MSAFKPHLEELCARASDVMVACVMGTDGLAIETVTQGAHQETLDGDALFVEFSSILGQVQNRTHDMAMGQVEEMSIRSQNFTCILRLINSEYFVAAAVDGDGNTGKARYLLRILAPKMIKEFV
jgi:predicted regulator of Ras-like GTPase activity (Roadblock/LC7/MglB family)